MRIGIFGAVMLVNYFYEHAPYAIRAMEKGIHVLSECTPAEKKTALPENVPTEWFLVFYILQRLRHTAQLPYLSTEYTPYAAFASSTGSVQATVEAICTPSRYTR